MSHDEDYSGDDKEELDVELDQAATSLPVERLPCIQETNAASAAEDLGDNLAGEGAVEGDNGVLILGQDGRLDADERDEGWEDDEEDASEHNDEDGQRAENHRCPVTASILGEVVTANFMEAKEKDEALCNIHGEVFGRGLDGGGESEDLPAGAGDDALPEPGVRRHRDNLVCPCGVEVGQQSTGDGGNNNETARHN